MSSAYDTLSFGVLNTNGTIELVDLSTRLPAGMFLDCFFLHYPS